jgi:hypothetical protein
VLPPSHAAWAAEQAEILLAALRDAKYDIVGDLADLRPAAEASPHASPADQPAVRRLRVLIWCVLMRPGRR